MNAVGRMGCRKVDHCWCRCGSSARGSDGWMEQDVGRPAVDLGVYIRHAEKVRPQFLQVVRRWSANDRAGCGGSGCTECFVEWGVCRRGCHWLALLHCLRRKNQGTLAAVAGAPDNTFDMVATNDVDT